VSIAVFDIDGVVADVRHRLHHLERRPKDWIAFFAEAADDEPLSEGLALVADLAERHEIAWLTGRPAWIRDITAAWLRRYGLPAAQLHMRGDTDRRPARTYKLGALERMGEVAVFIDDDERVVAAAKGAGFPAVLADWVPRGDALRDAQDRIGRT